MVGWFSYRNGWIGDFSGAPRGEKQFLVRLPDGLITTAYFYWYTEKVEGWSAVAYWALQDAVRDCPLDEDNPHLEGLQWRPMI